MRKIVYAASALFILNTAGWSETFKIMFETMDCTGNSGFLSVDADRIYRIETADCTNPDKPSEKLKKVLVKNGKGSYDLYMLTNEEARQVQKDIRAYSRSYLRGLENSDRLIIKREHR